MARARGVIRFFIGGVNASAIRLGERAGRAKS
jgi:hypothetical protein